ncbi:YdcH family protein [Rubrimonas cliftonensis]|uniref:DUF465 domain-containing protein n=1 Tax=Rubrimonas cliftonensis TaxID=89524 RepID=A0A1H3VHD9_9RHOB|nr:YdcH family protein [Rubrimonas cliftonensis]SDZ74176.1 hypothetical protein SAMN05444370_101100 [Rubrimonas cliftonensis]
MDGENGELAPVLAKRAQLAALRTEHRRLDAAIEAISADPLADQLDLRRLKKKKLSLRDEIARLDDELTPDIIA